MSERKRWPILAMGAVLSLLPACVVETQERAVYAVEAPPPERVEVVTVSPGTEYVWVRGHWRWTGSEYVWMGGHWRRRPASTAVWVPGHWRHEARGHVWVEGHWR